MVIPAPVVLSGTKSPPLPPTKLVALLTVTPAGKVTIISFNHSVSVLALVTVKVQSTVVPEVYSSAFKVKVEPAILLLPVVLTGLMASFLPVGSLTTIV